MEILLLAQPLISIYYNIFKKKVMKLTLKLLAFLLLISPTIGSCQQEKKTKESNAPKSYQVTKTDEEWRQILPSLTYQVLRKAATERAFSGELNYQKGKGIYACAGCNTPLYSSAHKYDSGSGWPSFDRGNDEYIEYDVDYKIGYARTELKCAVCGGHLGHMFSDGPRNTTGKRHCINSAALNFIPSENE